MAIAFTVQQNKFTDKKGRKLFYARLVKTGTKDSKYIAQRIAIKMGVYLHTYFSYKVTPS